MAFGMEDDMQQMPAQQMPMPQQQQQQPMITQQPQMMMPAQQQMPATQFPPDIQQRLEDNMRREMDDEVRSRRGAKTQQLISDLSGMVGPAIAAFGKGPGVTGGGVALMHSAAQAAQDTKAKIASEKMQHQNALKAYVDMYDKVGLRPAQKAIEETRKQLTAQQNEAYRTNKEARLTNQFKQGMSFKEKSLASQDAFRKGSISAREHATNVRQAYDQGILTLRNAGLKIDQQKADQVGKNMEEMMDIRHQYVQLRKQGMNDANSRAAKELAQKYAAMKLHNAEFNQNLAKQTNRKDSLGNYIYSGPDGKPLDASQFQVDFTAPTPQTTEPTPDELDQADQELQGQSQNVQGQVVHAPGPDPGQAMQSQVQQLDQSQQQGQQQQAPQGNPFAGRIQQLQKMGVSPEAAKQNFIQNRMIKQGMNQQQAMQAWQQMTGGQ